MTSNKHGRKLIVGHALGEKGDIELALVDWRKTKPTLKRLRQRAEGIIIHHNHDGVYLGHGWLYKVAIKGKVLVFHSEEGAKGNVYMESFIGRFKTENHLLF